MRARLLLRLPTVALVTMILSACISETQDSWAPPHAKPTHAGFQPLTLIRNDTRTFGTETVPIPFFLDCPSRLVVHYDAVFSAEAVGNKARISLRLSPEAPSYFADDEVEVEVETPRTMSLELAINITGSSQKNFTATPDVQWSEPTGSTVHGVLLHCRNGRSD